MNYKKLWTASLVLAPVLAACAGRTNAQPPAAPTQAAEPKNAAVEAIREEGLKHSQVMKTLSYLSDVIGPRLTGSPNLKRANEWTRDQMASWGLENAHLEAWGPFGKGWVLKKFSLQVVDPQCIPLIAFPKAWSTGVGPTIAEVVYLDAKTEADLEKYKGKLSGKIVLTAAPREIAAHFEPLGARKTDTQLLTMADSAGGAGQFRAGARQGQRGGGPGGPGGPGANGTGGPAGPGRAGARAGAGGPGGPGGAGGNPAMAFNRKKLEFLHSENPALVIEPSPRGDGGTLFVAEATTLTPLPSPSAPRSATPARRVGVYDKDAPPALPQVVMATENYNRLVRMIQQGESLKIAAEIEVDFPQSDLMAYNTIAEIPGTDLKDEIVMLGGHIDSWHSGTGTTDNGAGISVAMEAVRILKAAKLQPRRTVRVGLWSGEEEGLLGSRAYVKDHFGVANPSSSAMYYRVAFGGKPDPAYATKPEYEKLSVYFNLDNGTGKVRGVYRQGNEAARPIFRAWLAPFRDLGASTLTLNNTGGTDHLSFDGIGLPGFQFIQDDIEYDTRTHHSNQDVFDRAQEDDLKQASVIMAAFVYNASNMSEKFPRKPAPAMPAARRGFAF
jgi:carboxypeptidase Q